MADIFDQLAAQNTATAPASGQGDIFDQLAAKNKIEGTLGQHGSSYLNSGALQAGHPLLTPQEGSGGTNGFFQNFANAARNAIATPLNELGNAVVAGGQRIAENAINRSDLVNQTPQASQFGPPAQQIVGMNQQIAKSPVDPNTVSATMGGILGPIAETAIPGVGIPAFVAGQVGANTGEVAQADVEGRNVSPLAAASYVGGNAVLNTAGAHLLGGEGTLGERMLQGAGAMNANQYGQNLLARATGADPNRSLLQGIPEATTLGLGGGAVHGGAPEEAPRPPTEEREQQQVAAVEAKLGNPELSGRLGQGYHEMVDPLAPAPHLGYAHEIPSPPVEERTPEPVKPPRETPGFEKPEDVPQTAAEAEATRPLLKRLRDLQVENEQRQTENPQPPEGQPERRAFAGATFESPEEAGANKFFAEHQAGEKTPEPAATKPVPGQPSLMNRLMSEESGGTTALHDIVRAVPTAVKNAASGIHDLMSNIDQKFLGGDSQQAKQVSGDIRQSLGDAERVAHEIEAKFAPGREAVEKLTPAQKISLHDALENGTAATHTTPEIAQAAKDIQSWRKTVADRYAALGVKHLDTEGEGASRLFEFPEGGNGKGKSLAGNQSFLKKQAELPFSEQLKAVEAQGGKAKYTNPIDDQIHRLYQAERALSVREGLRAHDKMGAVNWGEPKGNQTERLKDPSIGSEERTLALPKWMVSKIANGPGHFDTEKFLDENENKGTWVRPGEDAPDGMTKTARTKKGDFYAAPDVAAKYNNLLKEPKATGIAAVGKAVMNGLIKVRYILNAGHAFMATHVGVVQNLGNAIGRGLHGEGGAALDSLKTMAGVGGNVEGHAFRRSIEAGTAGETGERVMASGANLHLRSAIRDNTVRKQFSDAMEDMKSEDPATRVKGLGKGVLTGVKAIHTGTFEEVLPNIVAAHLKTVAENQISRGISAEEGRPEMQAEAKRISRQVGNHFEDPDYRNTAARKIASALIPAYHFWEGNVINAGKVFTTTEGAAASRAFFATSAGTTAFLNTAIQAALTKANTGKALYPWDSDTPLEDLLHPRRGVKDENGNEGRISYPNPLTRMIDAARHPVNEAKAVTQPALTGGYETAVNKDWQGNQVRPSDASGVSNFFRGVGHTLKGYTPMGSTDFASSAFNSDEKGMLGAAGGMVGIRVSHPVTSDALQETYDQLDIGDKPGRNLEEQQHNADRKRWVAEARTNADQAKQDMIKAGADKKLQTSVLKQAREKQGLPGLVMDSALKPDGLIKIWNKATDDEKAEMRDSLTIRLRRDHGAETAEEQAAWKQLKGLVSK